MARFSLWAQLASACLLGACGSSDSGSSSTSDSATGSDTSSGDGGSDTQATTDSATGDSPKTDAPVDSTASDSTATDTATTPDGDAASTSIGAPCVDGSTCTTDFCITDPTFKNGYCSTPIGECPAPGGGTDPCPSGSSCVNGIPGGDACLKDCSIDGDCRVADGYKCCTGLGHSGKMVCAPSSLCP